MLIQRQIQVSKNSTIFNFQSTELYTINTPFIKIKKNKFENNTYQLTVIVENEYIYIYKPKEIHKYTGAANSLFNSVVEILLQLKEEKTLTKFTLIGSDSYALFSMF